MSYGSLRSVLLTGVLLILTSQFLARPAMARPVVQDPDKRPLVQSARTIEDDHRGIPRTTDRADTIDFGFYELRPDGLVYAVRGERWTFDHGATDSLEGWTSIDPTANAEDFWRQVTEAGWIAEGNPLPWPQMNASAGIALCGARKGQADSLGWAGGLGYGNHWCQRLTSPDLVYDGSGSVGLSFHYFNESEPEYDYSRVQVLTGSTTTLLNPPGFNGLIGIDTLGVVTQADYVRAIGNDELGGGTDPRVFQVVLEFLSDGAGSDVDGAWDAHYGALGVDDVVIDGANLDPPVTQVFDFETSLQGWTPSHCPGVGSYLGVAPVTQYGIQDPCDCGHAGYVLEMHDDSQQHPADPNGQRELAVTPICDRKGDIGDPAYLDYTRILAEWDQYSALPEANGVFYRPGWSYFPYENPHVPGMQIWSPRVGEATYHYEGSDPVCALTRDIGTNAGLPGNCEQVKFIYEIYSSCAAFGIPPEMCSGETNFSPILDNLRVRNVDLPPAPILSFEPGGRFQDGFGQAANGILSVTDPGNANTAYNTRFGNLAPAKLGDSLVVRGPVASASTRWEARLWLRLKRIGPGQASITLFTQWKNDFAAAKGILFYPPYPSFTWGYMDSVEVGASASSYKFCSQFRDGPSPGGGNLPADPMYSWGADTGEQDEGNEILPDLCFTPGTKIEYFTTSNYICQPGEYAYLPDTTGRYYEEFEILPSYRPSGGLNRFPCVLYIDASERGTDQELIEAGLWQAHSGTTDPIPELRPWDRYDYLDAASGWRATMYRELGGNSGATLYQLLGYKMILIDTGGLPLGTTTQRDWTGIDDWLQSGLCTSNNRVQGLYLSGSAIGEIIDDLRPTLLADRLGATLACPAYNAAGCPPGEPENDDNYCVRLEAVPSPLVPMSIPTDLYGNWCPGAMDADVFGATGAGIGNLLYRAADSADSAAFAQVVTNQAGAASRFRTILNGFDLGHLTARDLYDPGPSTECPHDSASAAAAIAAQLSSALDWLACGSFAGYPLCTDPPCFGGSWPYEDCDPEGAPEAEPFAFLNRLERAQPNPVRSRTFLRFTLAREGAARLSIYDVLGRRVRRLHDGPLAAGPHELTWDATNERGRRVSAGVYWLRIEAAGWRSERLMVVVR